MPVNRRHMKLRCRPRMAVRRRAFSAESTPSVKIARHRRSSERLPGKKLVAVTRRRCRDAVPYSWAPKACAASSRTNIPSASAIATDAVMVGALPEQIDRNHALGLRPSLVAVAMPRFSELGSMLNVAASTSTTPASPPISATASPVAQNVNDGQNTASPRPTPFAISTISSASVPLRTGHEWLAPRTPQAPPRAARLSGPLMNWQWSSTRATASSTDLPSRATLRRQGPMKGTGSGTQVLVHWCLATVEKETFAPWSLWPLNHARARVFRRDQWESRPATFPGRTLAPTRRGLAGGRGRGGSRGGFQAADRNSGCPRLRRRSPRARRRSARRRGTRSIRAHGSSWRRAR